MGLSVDKTFLGPYRAILYHFAIIPYVRESRRIIGVHTLTVSDFLFG